MGLKLVLVVAYPLGYRNVDLFWAQWIFFSNTLYCIGYLGTLSPWFHVCLPFMTSHSLIPSVHYLLITLSYCHTLLKLCFNKIVFRICPWTTPTHKHGQRIWIDVSPKKTHRWLTNTWKDAQHHSLFSSVQFSHSVMSDSLRPHESQHARPPCPSPTPRVHSNSHPSSRWCHPAISSSVVLFSSCP